MTGVIKKYLAGKVVTDFRRGESLEGELCKLLNTYEYINYIRAELAPGDVGWITKQLTVSTGGVLELILNLTWSLLPNDDIEIALVKRWDVKSNKCTPMVGSSELYSWLIARWKKGNKAYRSISLVYGLLNIENLDVSWHRKIFEDIKDNWDFYIDEETRYDGGADKSLDVARQRLEQGNVSPSKEWVYWFTAICSDDAEGVDEFFNSINADHPELNHDMNNLREEIKKYFLGRYSLRATACNLK